MNYQLFFHLLLFINIVNIIIYSILEQIMPMNFNIYLFHLLMENLHHNYYLTIFVIENLHYIE